MARNKLRYGILGAQEQDLPVLSALHNRGDIEIVFVYDRDRRAVGIGMAEILGLGRLHTPDQLTDVKKLDYAVVSEPREKFATEVEILSRARVKIRNPSEVLQEMAPRAERALAGEPREGAKPQTIDDTLGALERLFDRKELLKFLLDVAVEATGSSAGSIMLFSPETQDLYIGYAIGLSERVVKRTRQKLGEGIAGSVAQTRQPQLVTSPSETILYADSRERIDIASAISVPLLWGQRLLGVINVSVDSRGRPLDTDDLRKLVDLSRRISRVLEQSINIEEVKMRHREWAFRLTMGQIAAKSISAQEKFSVLARYLSDLIGADTVEIYLSTVEGDWFVLGGSNRLLSPKDERVRYRSGPLNRAFLENRCIVLSEGRSEAGNALSLASSVVYHPMGGRDPKSVIVLEFGEQHKLDEFLLIREAVVLEISRFLGWEIRERKLNRELRAFRSLADAASSVLGCKRAQDLADILAATAGLVLESERVSVRLRLGLSQERYAESFFGVPLDLLVEWRSNDEERFETLAKERKPFSTAFLSFEPSIREGGERYRSVLAFPLQTEDGFFGGIIAYNKNPDDPLEDAVYSEMDRSVLTNLSSLALPVLDSIIRRGPISGLGEPAAFDLAVAENFDRFKRTCTDEIGRSDRYHHTFTVLLFRMRVLNLLYARERERALALVDDMTRGLQTRTRKTDFGAWIRPDTYAILTLDGGRRIRFLVSRITAYLARDLSSLPDFPEEERKILVGSTAYPGPAKSAEELLAQAEQNLEPTPSD